jgi:two-component system, OmpR family, sensor kinase
VTTLSLRARLLLGVLVLALAGIVVADTVTYTELRSFLLTRVDRSLDDDHQGFERALSSDDLDEIGRQTPPGLFVQIRSDRGAILQTANGPVFPGAEPPPPPRLPASIAIPSVPGPGGPDRVSRFTVPATQGSGRYRVRASIDPGSHDLLVLATSLGDVDGTLHRLLLIELVVTSIVLLGIGAVGLWIVRLGLRPLQAIGRTAEQIAGGDLSHRVGRAEPRTEVGRLGIALNAMLDRIETSDRRLRRFVVDASHELRTPLAGIRAYAELFERGAAARPDDLARAMAGIRRESERMSGLVDDLLVLARLDEGQPLDRGPVDLVEIASDAVETARAVDPSRPLELLVEPAVVIGDRARLRRVFDNLLANVRSHTPPGTCATVRVASTAAHAVIEVADDGPGLSDADRERIFDRFYRVDPSRTRESGGVGLGLSIVARIAAAHGGEVAVISEPGGGATFRVTLPLAPAGPASSARSGTAQTRV